MMSRSRFVLILTLALFSLYHLSVCASYKRQLQYGEPYIDDANENKKLIRVQLLSSNKLESFDELRRSHDIVRENHYLEKRKPTGLDSQLVGVVEIGTPTQEFRFIFDTSQSNMWISSLNCSNCGHKKRYNSSASTTYFKNGTIIKTNSSIGFLSTDRVIFGNTVILNQTFTEMIKLDKSAVSAPYDGLFCLGYDRWAQKSIASPLREMLNQKQIDREMFSIYQNSIGGEILFGGYDRHRYKYDITFTPVAELRGWSFKMDLIALKQGGDSDWEDVTVCAKTCTVEIDTSMPYIIGPSSEVKALNEALGAKADEHDGSIYILPDCDLSKLPTLVLTIEWKDFFLKPEHYIQRVRKGDEIVCVSTFHVVNLPDPKLWIIGSSIVGHIYTVFDYKSRLVGFAEADVQ